MTDTNAPEHALETEKFTLPSLTYDNLRYGVNYVLPALAVFYATVAILLNWGYVDVVTGIVGALVVLLNVLLGKAKKNWTANEVAKNPKEIVGTMYVNTSDPEEAVVGLNLNNIDPLVLASKDTVTVKVDSSASQ